MNLAFARRFLMFGTLLFGFTVSVAAQQVEFADSSDDEDSEAYEDDIEEGVVQASVREGAFIDVTYNLNAPKAPNPGDTPKAPKKKKPKPSPYKTLFYNNDFSYLDDPNNTLHFFGDNVKRLRPGCDWLVSFGGEYRARYMHEHDLKYQTLLGLSDDFLLQRIRLYGDFKYKDWFRFYGEALDAISSYENLPPRIIEENRFDAQNLFVDLRLLETDNGAVWARGGRQEMLYGEQRLVSPLDWANARRTFDGAKMFYKGKDWDVDAWWTRPVPFFQHVRTDHNFDFPDRGQEFVGLYATHKANKDAIHDIYFLRLAETDAPAGLPDFDVSLFGTRWFIKQGSWLFDVEGAYQFGRWANGTQSAGFCTGGLGYEWPNRPWKPRYFTYYDYASGDREPNDGVHGTFNQLFPLAHKYFGFADLVARQNIHDLNFQLTASPTDKWTLQAWHHIFALDQAKDAMYNAAGVPIRRDITGGSGRYVGQELDLTAQCTLSGRSDILFGYSHFFAGTFVKNTNPVDVSGNADFFYMQFTRRF